MAAMGSPGLDNIFAKFDEHVIDNDDDNDDATPMNFMMLDHMAKNSSAVKALDRELGGRGKGAKIESREDNESHRIQTKKNLQGPREKIDEMENNLANLEKYWDA